MTMIRTDIRTHLIRAAVSSWFHSYNKEIPQDNSPCLSLGDALELIELIDGEAMRLLNQYQEDAVRRLGTEIQASRPVALR